jgi:acetyl esterase/lipase
VTIAPEYRTRNAHGTTPFESVRDAKSALRWIRAHAGQLGIDASRIAAGGGSAGGHLAAATGLLKGHNETEDDTTTSSRPNALVLFNPVLDNGPGGYGYDRIGTQYLEFSPLHNINPMAPPTIILVGTEDHLVPVRMVRDFQARMRQAGVQCELRLYDGQKHGFFNYREGTNEYYVRSLLAAHAFLSSLGYLQPVGTPSI